jgi:hypothetical protein
MLNRLSSLLPCVTKIPPALRELASGSVLIYDLMAKDQEPVLNLRDISKLSASQSAVALKFNRKQKDLLACGFTGCVINIYQLSQELTEKSNAENQFYQLLLENENE